MFYPLCGWIAEIFASNFKMIKWSYVFMLISSMTMLIAALLLILILKNFIRDSYMYITLCGVVIVVTGLTGLGMYESNAIQFGMNQMLGASSEQLSSFILWYFWCVNVGPLIMYYGLIGAFLYFQNCVFSSSGMAFGPLKFLGWVLMVSACIQLVISSCGIFISLVFTRCFTIEQISKNPLKIIFRVLMYSYKHKYPERRSAFTYWENDAPSRIDLGKEKYGGPFTYEQVEDVKTMFRLLLLMVSLFGYHLSGDGYSLTYYIMYKTGCPTKVPLIAMIIDPHHVTLVLVVLAVPLFQLIKNYASLYTPNLLNRVWLGLLFCLLSECIQCIYSFQLHKKEFECPEFVWQKNPTPVAKCIYGNMETMNNDSCEHFCSSLPVNDPLIYLSLVPLILNGLSYLLVFVTTVEFICAQSPNAMKGLLIGIWYSMLSIRYSVVNNLDVNLFLLEIDKWNIYHGIKGFCMFLSIISFSVVHKHYHYRERDEIVNEQAMIEEQYERELLLNSSSVLEHS